MREFSFFVEIFLCYAESEAESDYQNRKEITHHHSKKHERRAQTWFFRICVRSKDDKTF